MQRRRRVFALASPVDAPQRHGHHLGRVEVRGVVANGVVEHPPFAVAPLPDDGHDRAAHVGVVRICEAGGGEHMVVRVHVHVVLLGAFDLEVADAVHDGVAGIGDVHGVVDLAAGVRDKLAAGHKLVLRMLAEGVAHAAVPPGHAGAVLDGCQQAIGLLNKIHPGTMQIVGGLQAINRLGFEPFIWAVGCSLIAVVAGSLLTQKPTDQLKQKICGC